MTIVVCASHGHPHHSGTAFLFIINTIYCYFIFFYNCQYYYFLILITIIIIGLLPYFFSTIISCQYYHVSFVTSGPSKSHHYGGCYCHYNSLPLLLLLSYYLSILS